MAVEAMDELVSEFLEYLRFERYRSDHTVENYGADLRHFLNYIRETDSELTWKTVDSDIVRGWMEMMMDKGNSAASINRRLSSLRSFYRYAMSRGLCDEDPAYRVKGPKKGKALPQFLREDDMDRLLADSFWGDSFRELRAKTIILVFYSTGMRLSELIGLNDNSIDYYSCQLKVLGKRNKERVIPFGAELRDALREYQRQRNEKFGMASSVLFVADAGGRMTPYQVRREVQRCLSKVSTMKKRSPHVLRHTFATAMLNNESKLGSVQKLLGHASVATTEIYTHTTFEQLKKMYGKAHPRGENQSKDSKSSR